MAKKPVEIPETQELIAPTTLTPAAVIGMNTNLHIDEALLPEAFQGQTLEVLQTGFAPTVKWVNPGNYVAGVFVGVEREVGPNGATLYTFDANVNGGKPKQFGVWGTTVLDRAFSHALKELQLKPGYLVLITFMGELPGETGQNPCKLFNISVVKR